MMAFIRHLFEHPPAPVPIPVETSVREAKETVQECKADNVSGHVRLRQTINELLERMK